MVISWTDPRFIFKIPSNIFNTGATFEFIPVIIIYNCYSSGDFKFTL